MAAKGSVRLTTLILLSITEGRAPAQTRPMSIVVDELRDGGEGPVVRAMVEGLDHFEQHRWQDAVQCFDRCLNLNPRLAQVLAARGRALIELERFAESECDYRSALAIAPEDKDLYSALALLYQRWGRWPEARATLRQLIERVPEDASALNALALAEMRCGQLRSAAAHLERARKLVPDWPIARFNRAQLLLRTREPHQAEAEIDCLLKELPDSLESLRPHALLTLLRARVDVGDAAGAKAAYASLLAVEDSPPDARVAASRELGELEASAGRLDAAIECLEQCVVEAESLESPTAYAELGRLYARQGRLRDAVPLIEIAVLTQGRFQDQCLLALLHEDQGEFENARGYLEPLYEEGLRLPILIAALSRLEEASGNRSRAEELFAELIDIPVCANAWRDHPVVAFLALDRCLHSGIESIRKHRSRNDLLQQCSALTAGHDDPLWSWMEEQTGFCLAQLLDIADQARALSHAENR